MHAAPMLTARDARHVLEYLRRRARTDAVFRKDLLSDPKSALKRELEIELPEDFNIRFVENAGAHMTVVLPDPEVSGRELSDDQLMQIFGGVTSTRPEVLRLILKKSESYG